MISFGLPGKDIMQVVCDSEDELPEAVNDGTMGKVRTDEGEDVYIYWGGAWKVVKGGSGQGDVPVEMMLFDVSSGTEAVLIGVSDDYEAPADGYEIVVPTTYQNLPVKGAGGADMETWTSAFVGCTSFSSDSIETLDEIAFANCTALASISLPSATTIGEQAFSICTSLTSVSLPSATSVGLEAFYDCSSLSSVSLPVATDIGMSVFYGCTSLTSVSLPAATDISGQLFKNCTSLASVSLPAATTIGEFAFEGCTAIEHVEFGPLTTVNTTSFPAWTFYDTDGTTVLNKKVASNLANSTFEGTASRLVKNAPTSSTRSMAKAALTEDVPEEAVAEESDEGTMDIEGL